MPKNIKNNTLKEILDVILYEAPSTQDEIANKLNISRRYVTKLLKPLIDEDIIKKAYVVDLKKINDSSELFETHSKIPESSGEFLVKDMLNEMGDHICKLYTISFKSLVSNDINLANTVLNEEENTKRMHEKIKSSSDTVMTLDPYFEFSNTLIFNEIAYDMERISDHILHIANFVIDENTEIKESILSILEEMFDLSLKMFKKAVKSFMNEFTNKEKSKQYEIDLHNLQSFAMKKISSNMAKDDIDKKRSKYYLSLFRVVRSFERIGDISIEIIDTSLEFYHKSINNKPNTKFKYLNSEN